jgi:phosphatidylglycerophosphate synthase
VLAEVRELYRQSKKKRDNFWTEWVSRPPAAVLVWLLKSSSVTPNQVSFAAIFVAMGGCATMIFWRTWSGLIASGLLLQLAYVIDCADGQLARVKQMASPVGALLDFMLDEVKAFCVIASAAVRLWWMNGHDDRWLLYGLVGGVAAAIGITLTTFMRTSEYRQAIGAPPVPPATERAEFKPTSWSPLALIEAAGRFVLHYPSWFLFICIANRLDIFMYAYLGAHVLYLGRASLMVVWKLGRLR